MRNNQGFTLMEILLSLSILIVGLVGILALFPVGLNATREAIEETQAAIIAESLYDSLRASVRQMQPGDTKFVFYFDNCHDHNCTLPATKDNSVGIPGPTAQLASGSYLNSVSYSSLEKVFEDKKIQQYSYNVELSYPNDGRPDGLYDVIIRIRRSNRMIKKFYSQIAVPSK